LKLVGWANVLSAQRLNRSVMNNCWTLQPILPRWSIPGLFPITTKTKAEINSKCYRFKEASAQTNVQPNLESAMARQIGGARDTRLTGLSLCNMINLI